MTFHGFYSHNGKSLAHFITLAKKLSMNKSKNIATLQRFFVGSWLVCRAELMTQEC